MENMINLETFANGAFAERTNEGIQQVLDNIADPNTEWKPKRKVTIELTFDTTEQREITNITTVVKTRLTPKSAVKTIMLIDRNLKGEVLGAEFKKQVAGQTFMTVDPETGEVLSEPHQEVKETVNLDGIRLVK